MANFEKIGQHKIFFDQMYFLAYAGGSRELDLKNQKTWDKTIHLPGELQTNERNKIGLEHNPNVVPLSGRNLLMFIKELQFIPLFDKFFHKTNVLQLTDAIIYESIKAKSYDIAMKT